jgi:hypothetical protein
MSVGHWEGERKEREEQRETNGYEAANQAASPPFAPIDSPMLKLVAKPAPKGIICISWVETSAAMMAILRVELSSSIEGSTIAIWSWKWKLHECACCCWKRNRFIESLMSRKLRQRGSRRLQAEVYNHQPSLPSYRKEPRQTPAKIPTFQSIHIGKQSESPRHKFAMLK